MTNKKPKFFICKHCGNLVGMIFNSGAPMTCCGDKMTELVPNTTEAAHEKHLPVISISGDKVTVKIGSVEHPMTEQHYIQWVYLDTKHGGQRKALNPGDKPEVEFAIDGDEVIGAYIYCNLHGLWETEI
jgi:superoxide reductase